MKIIKIALITLLVTAFAATFWSTPPTSNTQELDYSNTWCESQGGNPRAVLSDRTKPDCLLENEVVEFDWGKPQKAYECVGQALHYAKVTGLTPVCILIQKQGISDAEFFRAVSRISSSVVLRCMDAGGKLFACPSN